MKFLSYQDGGLGLLVHDRVVDISALVCALGGRRSGVSMGLSMLDLIKAFPDIKGNLLELETKADTGIELASLQLCSPLYTPSKIICTVDNYLAHGAECQTDIFPKPVFFMKPVETLIGPNGTIILPREARRVDHELELAVVIGERCRRVSADRALSYVFGYTIFLDISARDFRTIPYSWFSMKGWDTFGPIGPYIVTKDEVGNPQDLDMRLWVNGQLRMQGSTSEMVFSVAQLIEAASEVTTLLPGDIIATGTIEGIAPVIEGDIITAEIERLGILRMQVARSQQFDTWHTADYPDIYTRYRAESQADVGADKLAPKSEVA